jgi:hypothetical protein
MTLRQCLWARFTPSRAARADLLRACVPLALLLGGGQQAGAGTDAAPDYIQLELSPRICTLSAGDRQCETRVRATWQSPRVESLCLVIVDRPEVKRCWENYSEGTYSIELTFAEDLVFQLKDLELQNVLASEALRVIREAIRYRHKRREPWNIFD